MQLLHVPVTYAERSQVFRLWHLTDLHIGARSVDEALLKRHVQQIAADPFALWIGGGDYIDALARKGDKRYHEAELAPWLHGKDDVVQHQCDRVVDLLSPIASKCIGLVGGNHEAALLQYQDRDAYRVIVRGLAAAANKTPEVLALGVGGFIRLSFRHGEDRLASRNGWTLTIYAHHGAGGGRLAGGDALFLERLLADYDCDLALCGHRHKLRVITRSVVKSTLYGVRVETRMAMMSASYMRSHIDSGKDGWPVDSYPENKALPATQVGATPILIVPADRQFHAVISSGGEGVGQMLPALTG